MLDLTKPILDPSEIDLIKLESGIHERRGVELCTMEVVAWLNGEPHTDQPDCTSPVIRDFVIGFNDMLDNKTRRSLLLPRCPRIVGTNGILADDKERSLMSMNWLIRTYLPACLEMAGWMDMARATRNLGTIMDAETMAATITFLHEMYEYVAQQYARINWNSLASIELCSQTRGWADPAWAASAWIPAIMDETSGEYHETHSMATNVTATVAAYIAKRAFPKYESYFTTGHYSRWHLPANAMYTLMPNLTSSLVGLLDRMLAVGRR